MNNKTQNSTEKTIQKDQDIKGMMNNSRMNKNDSESNKTKHSKSDSNETKYKTNTESETRVKLNKNQDKTKNQRSNILSFEACLTRGREPML